MIVNVYIHYVVQQAPTTSARRSTKIQKDLSPQVLSHRVLSLWLFCTNVPRKVEVMNIFSKIVNAAFIGVPALIALLTSALSYSAGKALPNAACGSSQLTTPTPVRKVRMQTVGTKIFQLPNGAKVDIHADLESILNTIVASSSAFSPEDGALGDPCNSHLEIRSTVSTFQLDMVELGVSIGFNPSGSMSAISSVTGKANVKLGLLAMDFSLWSCSGLTCSAIAASNATNIMANLGMSAVIDFGAITTGPSLIFNSPLGPIFRQIMANGIGQLVRSPRLVELPWQASVKEYLPAAGLFIFDAGVDARILPNQAFEVYAPVDQTDRGVCNVYQTVAIGHTASVGAVSSAALVDQTFDSRGVKVGDVVMVHLVGGLR